MAVKGNNPIFLACFNSITPLTAGSSSWRAAVAKRVVSVSCEDLCKICITLTSRKVSSLENFYQELIDHSKSKNPCVRSSDAASAYPQSTEGPSPSHHQIPWLAKKNHSALTGWQQPETHDSACITITATVARAAEGKRRNVTSPPKTFTLNPPTTTARETSLLSRPGQPDAYCPSNSSPNYNNTEALVLPPSTFGHFRLQPKPPTS